MSDFESKELFPRSPAEQAEQAEREQRTALVHVLTPEFHGLDPAAFDDISNEVVARASASELQPNLVWVYQRRSSSEEHTSHSAISYHAPHEGFVSVALTPKEYDAMSTSIQKLADRAYNKVLISRDNKLQEASGDPLVRARSQEDIRTARRGALRPVLSSREDMKQLLDEQVLPKIALIDRFMEMTEGKNPNLSRGTRATVSERFEELRTTVFDDMLDVIGLQRGWTPELTEKAKRIIQKRLYMSGSPAERVANFKDMLALAQNYYGYKQALIRTRIGEADAYVKKQPDVLADIEVTDEERGRVREAKQLSLEE